MKATSLARLTLAAALAGALSACAGAPFSWQEAAQGWLAYLCQESDDCDWRGDGAVFH